VGDAFLKAAKLPAMRVPSAVVLGEFCFILNPLHPRIAELVVGKSELFAFDPRIK
jgi:hypothetical protein